MKALFTACFLLGLASLAHAADGPTLSEKHSCSSCHSATTKMVGPAYKTIATKYNADYKKNAKAVEAKLLAKIAKGGDGVWGSTPMPGLNVPAPEALTLVRWVLTQK